nr:unnamed protein product [Callosobruchus chinensis]
MYYIVIREKKDQDTPAVSEVVRNAYLSNVFPSWQNTFFSEVTFQMIIITTAFMFIVVGIPLLYCLVSVPIVLIGTYILIYGTVLMKAAQLLYEKKELKCWVAEAYEPLFFSKNPKGCWYKILTEEEFQNEEKPEACSRKWCRNNKFNNIELVITECHEGPRQLFDDAGFEVSQLYHKKLFTSAVTLQMFQLRSSVRPVF